ncbi:CBS domain-containing protein [Amycolatopsis aidingensis]|uniref:CBS domain-containing protein n=1 Tax=Amycolatopsis aidingensis TaxID=2842453 RepID=UPI001C0B0CAE|nr:CBS domain-containing protein [Amycolatopsis aidingensis]
MRGPTVAEVMTSPAVTVEPTTPFKEIATILAEHRISAVAVVDGQLRPVGVVSEADLLIKEEQRGQAEPSPLTQWRRRHRWNRARGKTAGEIMTPRVATIGLDERLGAAARRLVEQKLRRLFVVDDSGRVAGVLARRDVLSVFRRPDEELGETVEQEVFRRSLWADPATFAVRVRDGMVHLTGQLERRSEVDMATSLTASIPGVVDVRNDLQYDFDDITARR